MQAVILNAKKQLDLGQHQQVLDTCASGLHSDPNNSFLLLFQSQAFSKLGQIGQSLQSIEQGRQTLNTPKDDALVPQFARAGIDTANIMLQSSNPNERNDGAQYKIKYMVLLTDFLEKKEKWDKYLEEVEVLQALYIEQDLYNMLENLYMRMFQNEKLPQEKRHQAAINIFTLPSYYKPQTQLSIALLTKIQALCPESPDNAKMCQTFFKMFDKRPRFTFYENRLEDLPQYKSDMKDLISLSESTFLQRDFTQETNVESLFKAELSIFFKFLLAVTLLVDQKSPQWKFIVGKLEQIAQSQTFKKAVGSDQTFSLSSMISVIIDCEAGVFTTGSHSYLAKVTPEQVRDKEIANLKVLIQKKATPLANLVLSEYYFAIGQNYQEVLTYVDQGINYLRDLRNNTFNECNEWEVKLRILKCKILLTKKVELTPVKRSSEFNTAVQKLKELSNTASNFSIINQELHILIYNFKMFNNDMIGAKEFLEDFEKGTSGLAKSSLKEDWVKSQKAWLNYSFIDSSNKANVKVIKDVVILLRQALELNPQNVEAMLRLGTICFLYEHELEVSPKQCFEQWLGAFKSNPNSHEVLYCLAVYYYCTEKDIGKAVKCLDRLMMLRADFDDAAVLYYHILIQQGNQHQAKDLLDKIQKMNPLLSYPYYLQGLKAQNQGDYAEARILFESAARFQGYSASGIDNIKSNCPSLRMALSLKRSDEETLYGREMGAFSKDGIAVWLHLAECYLQMEKYLTAEKCMKNVFTELNVFLQDKLAGVEEEKEINREADGTTLTDQIIQIIIPFTQHASITEDLKSVLSNIRKVFTSTKIAQPESLQLDLLEALILGSKVELKVKNYHESLMYASIGLQNVIKSNISEVLNDQIRWECIQLVIESLLFLIDENLGGKADRQQLEKKKFVRALSSIADAVSSQMDVSTKNERVSRLLASAFKVVGEESLDVKYVKKAINIVERLTKESKVDNPQYRRGLMLDLARLYHLIELVFEDKSQSELKIKIIRQLLKENPGQGEYWVYHGIFQKNEDIKMRSFYKALEIDSQDQFALNNILCLHMRKGHYRQSLKVLNHIRDIESLNALVVALMVILHARVALESKEGHLDQRERMRYLSEAISIGEMFLEIEQEKLDQAELKITDAKLMRDPRVDIHQFLSTQMNYLVTLMRQESGDKSLCNKDVREILLEKIQQTKDAQDKSFLQKMLLKQSIGAGVGQLKDLQVMIQNSIEQGDKSQKGLAQIVDIIQVMQMQDNKALVQATIESQNIFLKSPSNINALQVLALQEQCLQQKVPLTSVFIEEIKVRDFKKLVDKLDQSIATKLVHQCLQLLYTKYPYSQDKISPYSYVLEENAFESLKQLPSIEYEKVFTLHLLNSLGTSASKSMFRRELKRVMARNIDKINTLIGEMRKAESLSAGSLFTQIMKLPHNLVGYNMCIWAMLKNGEIQKVAGFVKVVQFKITQGIIYTFTDKELATFGDYRNVIEAIESSSIAPLSDCQSLSPHLISVVSAFISIKSIGKAAPQDPKVYDEIISKIIQPWIEQFQDKEEILEDQLTLIYNLLNKLLLRSGHLVVFNEIADLLVKSMQDSEDDFFKNEFKVFLLLNMTSNFNILGKKAQAPKTAQLAESIAGFAGSQLTTRRHGLKLLRATLKLSVNQPVESHNLLKSVDQNSYELDVITAITLFQGQEYKQYYLACIQLVAALKQELASKVFGGRVQAEDTQFMLGYAYFLKARAEQTFMEARKQGITLKEDFNQQEAQLFNVEHFQRKAKRSIQKSVKVLEGWNGNGVGSVLTEFASKL